MKKVVVTGGAGFIGSHLVEELAKQGYDVVVLDDLSTGKLQNIEPLLKNKNTKFVKGSITDLSALQSLFKGVDYVFHQAALPSVPRSIQDPLTSHEVNATGTLKVLIAARDNGVKKVVYASSSSVYGDTPSLPKKEDMFPTPMSPYAVTKVAGEYYCRVFNEIYQLPTACLRYFNVYGPRQDPNSQYSAVIPKFFKNAFEGKPPVIFGDGEQTRDFVFVKDVVSANILAATTGATGVFNIGTGERTSVNHLAELVIGFSKNKFRPIYKATQAGDVKHSLADISRAKTFGYNPKFTLEQGLKEVAEGF